MNHPCCPLSPCPTARCCNADPTYFLREPARQDLSTSQSFRQGALEGGTISQGTGLYAGTGGTSASARPIQTNLKSPCSSLLISLQVPALSNQWNCLSRVFQRVKVLLPSSLIYSEIVKGSFELWALKRPWPNLATILQMKGESESKHKVTEHRGHIV